jgi:hypothetical protein
MEEIPSSTTEKNERIRSVDVLNKIIESAPKISGQDVSKAPFADYAQNTQESWNMIPPEEVDEYLKQKLFFNTSHIPYDSKKEIGEVSSDEPIKIPLDLIVYAEGFSDWRGRKSGEKSWNIKSGEKKLDGAMASLNVIKLYAGTPSEIPEVGFMQMYIQPNKKVFFDNGAGDSHRIAAAILRGDKYIETKFVIVYQLDEDYI